MKKKITSDLVMGIVYFLCAILAHLTDDGGLFIVFVILGLINFISYFYKQFIKRDYENKGDIK